MIIRKLSDNTKTYIDRYFAIVNEMSEAMRGVEPSDSISEMYIAQMLAHNSGAVNMSENILTYTTNANIETLAKSIVKYQSEAIETLSAMKEECSNCKNEERDVNLYQRRFSVLLENMLMGMNNINVSNNIDVDFLSGLIAHHEGAINMAKNVLGYEICKNLETYAENLITTHELQLSQMRQLLRILN